MKVLFIISFIYLFIYLFFLRIIKIQYYLQENYEKLQ